jgi:hypothetical protein
VLPVSRRLPQPKGVAVQRLTGNLIARFGGESHDRARFCIAGRKIPRKGKGALLGFKKGPRNVAHNQKDLQSGQTFEGEGMG